MKLEEPRLVNLRRAARLLNLSPTRIRQLIDQGVLDGHRERVLGTDISMVLVTMESIEKRLANPVPGGRPRKVREQSEVEPT